MPDKKIRYRPPLVNNEPVRDNTYVYRPPARSMEELILEQQKEDIKNRYNNHPDAKYWDYKNQVGRNIGNLVKGAAKVSEDMILPAAATAASVSMAGPQAISGLGAITTKQMLGLAAKGMAGGAAMDHMYQQSGGQFLGNALDVGNPIAREALNMVSPGMLAGGYSAVSPQRMARLKPRVGNTTDDVVRKNLQDLNYAKEYYSKYNYEIPDNIAEIAMDSKATDETIQRLVNQHNTFVRGVSTNWDEIGKRNPEILRHLEGKGIDWKNNPQVAAEYMATHVPIKTGYGRAGLNSHIFKAGKDGIYTSNSIPTAEGYTYGDGFIVKAKRPTDFSSKNRVKWIDDNKLEYFENEIPFDKIKRRGLLPKYVVKGDKNILKTEYIYSQNNKLYNLNQNIDQFLKEKPRNRISIDGEYSYPGGKLEGDVIHEDVIRIDKEIRNKYMEKIWPLIEKGKDNQIRQLDKAMEDEIYTSIMDYMSKYKFFDPINRYAHYIHIGTPGQKLLEPIESIRITPDIWKNKSRAHTNVYSRGLSAGTLMPFAMRTSQYKWKKNESGSDK